MAVANDCAKEAAALLNDPAMTEWDFGALLPYLQKAHRELQVELNLNGLPVIKDTSAIITVPALTVDLTAPAGGGASLQPANLIEPDYLEERQTGTTNLFADMEETVWDVNDLQEPELRFWSWRNEKILFLGATAAVDIRIHYKGGLTVPASENDALGFINAQLFLAPRTAALAAGTIGSLIAKRELDQDAENWKAKVIRYNIRGMQGSGGVRRIPYRRRRISRGRIS